MMSKKQWFVLLCIFVIYLLVGAAIFLFIERKEEMIEIEEKRKEMKDIEDLMNKYFDGNMGDFYRKLEKYCEKPLRPDMSQIPPDEKWNFYSSVFFVITVVSTIGYGNLSPTTTFTRIFMIFYGLIGIPLNGIVIVTLGAYFSDSFRKLYSRWKNSKLEHDAARMGLIGQVILYLIPGFTFFIFLPSTIMTVFENWKYDEAVYYCFVTLTTIGFGDYVAGTNDSQNFGIYYSVYKVFILVWVIGGLGYVVMVLNFITQGLRHKKILQFEHMLSENIKNTPKKIRQELRTILQEFLFSKVKPVYKDEFEYVPNKIERRHSCPDLTLYRSQECLALRRRALSVTYRDVALKRIQSETDLENIDKERTFKPSETFMQQKDLLLKVVDALSFKSLESTNEEGGINCFSDEEILASEGISCVKDPRRRALSDVVPPRSYKGSENNTWYGEDAQKALKELKGKRAFSIPENIKPEQSFWSKFKNKFQFTSKETSRFPDIEKGVEFDKEFTGSPGVYSERRQSTMSKQEQILEETSIADFIRALSAITVPEVMKNKDEKLSSPPRSRRPAIRANFMERRPSLMPGIGHHHRDRRLSLRPPEETPQWIRKISLLPPTIRENESRRPSLRNVIPPVYSGGRRFSLKTDEPSGSRRSSTSIMKDTNPPPYSLLPPEAKNLVRLQPQRKFSVNPVNLASLSGTSPVQRQVQKRERTDTESSGDKQN